MSPSSRLRVDQVFLRTWVNLGHPMATVVKDESTWNLFGDVKRDKLLDAYVDSDGNKVPLSDLWETEDIRILPTTQDALFFDIDLGGINSSGRMAFIAKSNDRELLDNCFRVILDGKEFVVDQLDISPSAQVRFITVTLALWSGDPYRIS